MLQPGRKKIILIGHLQKVGGKEQNLMKLSTGKVTNIERSIQEKKGPRFHHVRSHWEAWVTWALESLTSAWQNFRFRFNTQLTTPRWPEVTYVSICYFKTSRIFFFFGASQGISILIQNISAQPDRLHVDPWRIQYQHPWIQITNLFFTIIVDKEPTAHTHTHTRAHVQKHARVYVETPSKAYGQAWKDLPTC